MSEMLKAIFMTTRKIMGISTRRVAGLPAGSKAAVFAPASRRDRVKLSSSATWTDVTMDTWTSGILVHAFNMWGRFPFEVGDQLEMNGLDDAPTCYAHIDQITMVDGASLTEAQIHALGYADQADWQRDGLPSRRGWFVSVCMTGERRPHPAPKQIDVEVRGEDNVERFSKRLDTDD